MHKKILFSLFVVSSFGKVFYENDFTDFIKWGQSNVRCSQIRSSVLKFWNANREQSEKDNGLYEAYIKGDFCKAVFYLTQGARHNKSIEQSYVFVSKMSSDLEKNGFSKRDQIVDALSKNNIKAATLLLKVFHNFSDKVDEKTKDTAINLIARSGNYELLNLGLSKYYENRSLINNKDIDGRTPLHAFLPTQYDRCDRCVSSGEGNPTTSLDYMVIRFKYLEAEFNTVDNNDYTLLMSAIIGLGRFCPPQLIFESDVNFANSSGVTPLMVAAREGSCVDELIRSGASVDAKNIKGDTALDYALGINAFGINKKLKDEDWRDCKVDSVEVLIKNGADYKAALFKAIKKGNIRAVKSLIEAGVSINTFNKEGYTAFKYAKYLAAVKVGQSYKDILEFFKSKS